MCQRCWQPIGWGIAHPNPCTVQNARENLQIVIGQVPRAAEIIASDVIKTKFVTFEGGGSNAILATRGGDLIVTKSVNFKKSSAYYCSNPVSAIEIIRFQSTLGLSSKQTHKATTFFRTWADRKSIESSLAGKLSQFDKALESFYSSHCVINRPSGCTLSNLKKKMPSYRYLLGN